MTVNAIFKTCLLIAIAATPAFAQAVPGAQATNPLNCPMMTDVDQMQKQMSGMMTDMRAMMDGTKDAMVKSRMRTMHEHMSAMMANMQKMHGGMMRAPDVGDAKAAEPPTQAPGSSKQNHEEHHP
jgi:Skp family chaperone for outer membrane proteins